MIHTITKVNDRERKARTHFDSVNELVETINSKPFDKYRKEIKEAIYDGFYGVKSWSQCETLQKSGYVPDGGFSLDIEVNPTLENREEFVMDYGGIMPDVGVYLSGEPQCMVNYFTSEAEVKVLKLAIQCNCNGGYTAQQLIKHSEEVFHAVRWAQSKGYQIELVALLYNSMYSERITTEETFTITLMKQGDVISASRIAAAIHVSLFRCLWFTWANKTYGSCGGSINPPEKVDDYYVIPSTEFLQKKKMNVENAVKEIIEKTSSIPA
jgi:hypothetical protein